jgi:hypothetical protein
VAVEQSQHGGHGKKTRGVTPATCVPHVKRTVHETDCYDDDEKSEGSEYGSDHESGDDERNVTRENGSVHESFDYEWSVVSECGSDHESSDYEREAPPRQHPQR